MMPVNLCAYSFQFLSPKNLYLGVLVSSGHQVVCWKHILPLYPLCVLTSNIFVLAFCSQEYSCMKILSDNKEPLTACQLHTFLMRAESSSFENKYIIHCISHLSKRLSSLALGIQALCPLHHI